jgi:7-cyano-7-deazaguanine synthase
MAKELAVVLNDGSIEAAVTCALAAQRHRIALVYAGTEGAAAARRRAAFDAQAGHFAAQKVWVVSLAGLEPDTRSEPSAQRTLLSAVGPASLATQAAARWNAAALFLPLRTGPAFDDLARGTEFVQIYNELLQLPCGRETVEITAPVLELEPWQLVDLGVQVEAPFELTWSCETPGPSPCTLCEGCKSREAAFLRAVKPDPLRIR